MTKVFLSAIIIAFCAFLGAPAQARTIWFGDKAETLEIRYGKATVLRFEAKVSSVQNAEKFEVAPLNDQAPNYAEMSVKPRSTASPDTVTFHLVNGSVAMLRLTPVSGPRAETLETFHIVKKRQDLALEKSSPSELLAESTEGGESDEKVELMKALILGSKIRGYQIRNVEKVLATGLEGVDAILLRVYAGKELNGYVFKLTNKASKSKYEVDIRRLRIGEPNLALMSQVDRKVIEPESTGKNIAYLTIVALPSSLSRDVVLPVAWVKKEAK